MDRIHRVRPIRMTTPQATRLETRGVGGNGPTMTGLEAEQMSAAETRAGVAGSGAGADERADDFAGDVHAAYGCNSHHRKWMQQEDMHCC